MINSRGWQQKWQQKWQQAMGTSNTDACGKLANS